MLFRSSLLQEYLCDASSKEGDATILTDESNNRYYVVEFIERYLDQTPSINMRAIITESRDASAILEEWINGEATEESFIAIANLYDENDMSDNEFLYEGIVPSGLEQELADWIYEGNRQKGDTTAITTEDGVNYVLYYLEENAPEWSLLIKSTLLSTIMTEYLEEITTDFTVVDKKGNLKYLQIEN